LFSSRAPYELKVMESFTVPVSLLLLAALPQEEKVNAKALTAIRVRANKTKERFTWVFLFIS